MFDAQISALHGKLNIPVKCLSQRPIYIQTKQIWCWMRNLSNYLDISFNLIKFNFASFYVEFIFIRLNWLRSSHFWHLWMIDFIRSKSNVRHVPIQLWQSNKTIYCAPKTNEWNSHFHRWFGLTVFADQTPASLPKIWKIIEKLEQSFFLSAVSNQMSISRQNQADSTAFE